MSLTKKDKEYIKKEFQRYLKPKQINNIGVICFVSFIISLCILSYNLIIGLTMATICLIVFVKKGKVL